MVLNLFPWWSSSGFTTHMPICSSHDWPSWTIQQDEYSSPSYLTGLEMQQQQQQQQQEERAGKAGRVWVGQQQVKQAQMTLVALFGTWVLSIFFSFAFFMC